jgi:hypothetical protein
VARQERDILERADHTIAEQAAKAADLLDAGASPSRDQVSPLTLPLVQTAGDTQPPSPPIRLALGSILSVVVWLFTVAAGATDPEVQGTWVGGPFLAAPFVAIILSAIALRRSSSLRTIDEDFRNHYAGTGRPRRQAVVARIGAWFGLLLGIASLIVMSSTAEM